MNHPAKSIALLLLLGCGALKAEPFTDSAPSKDQKSAYKGESFYAPKMTLSISTLRAQSGPPDVFVQLLEQPDKRVLSSLHWPGAHHVAALWNPDSTMVAINYLMENDVAKLKVFHVSASGLTEIPLPKSLSIKKLAPPTSSWRDSDPAGENITATRWKSSTELFCLIESAAKKDNAKPTVYEALLGFTGKEATLLSSKPSEQKR